MTDHPSALVSVPVEADGHIASAIAASVRRLAPCNVYVDSGLGRLIWRDAIAAALAAPQAARVGFSVDDLAQEIRRVDGSHDLGAGALAESLMPFLSLRAPSREPEGGAVKCEACGDTGVRPTADGVGHYCENGCALATREEATAEDLRDALRGAVEALEPFAAACLDRESQNVKTLPGGASIRVTLAQCRAARKALAALQAEQGAK